MPQVAYLRDFEMGTMQNWLNVEIRPTCSRSTIDYVELLSNAFPDATVSVIEEPKAKGLIVFLGGYRYRLITHGIPKAGLQELLALYKTGVSISDELDECLALDSHFIPQEYGDDSRLVRTVIGELIDRAKYKGDKNAATQLCDLAVRAASSHPRISGVQFIGCPTSNDNSKQLNLCDLLCNTLCEALSLEVITVDKIKEVSPQKDQGDDLATLQENVDGAFKITADLEGGQILIVDDVYRSGATLNELGQACRNAGAEAVFGLVLSKTMKFALGIDYTGRTLDGGGIYA